MTDEPNSKPPQRIYKWTSIVWVIGVIAHLIWYVVQLRDQPPTDEVYAQMLSFQVAAFAATALPYWLGLLLVVLILEFALFARKRYGAVLRSDSKSVS